MKLFLAPTAKCYNSNYSCALMGHDVGERASITAVSLKLGSTCRLYPPAIDANLCRLEFTVLTSSGSKPLRVFTSLYISKTAFFFQLPIPT